MKSLSLFSVFIALCCIVRSQSFNCTFKEPSVTINFGTGPIGDRSNGSLFNYRFVTSSCPTDGHYTYASATTDCFRGDWITLNEDHTPGDADGNMLIVNASYSGGSFFSTNINRLKPSTTYESSVWMLNVCRPTDKCPFPLLPDIAITLIAGDGKVHAQMSTGELIRRHEPQWTRYQVVFTTPATEGPLTLTMIDGNPGGCGNDFAVDDISFRECIIVPPPVTKKTTPVKKAATPVVKKTTPQITKAFVPVAKPPVVKKDTSTRKPLLAKADPPKKPAAVPVRPVVKKDTVKKQQGPSPEEKTPAIVSSVPKVVKDSTASIKPKPFTMPPPPALIAGRLNPLVKLIEVPTGEVKVDLYDNGQIDGDTVSLYHNNRLVVSHAKLSTTPISLKIKMDPDNPHHELVLVAHNLGSIPPNTSLMVVNAAGKRYEVFISSNEQKNAKVVFDLRD